MGFCLTASVHSIIGLVRLGPFTLLGGLSAQMLSFWSHGDGPPLGTGTHQGGWRRFDHHAARISS